MKKIVAFLAAGILAVSLMGCAGGSTEEPARQESPQPENTAPAVAESETVDPIPLELLESGYYIDKESGYVHYGIGLKNPNTAFQADYPTINIVGKDADGKIVFSDDQVLMFMLPGAEYYYGGQCGNGTAPETVEFSLSVQDRNWIPNNTQSVAMYKIDNTNEIPDDYGRASYTGELTTLESFENVDSVCLSVILRNDAGEIVYGDCTFENAPAKDQTTAFEIGTWGSPEHSSYEIYAQPW